MPIPPSALAVMRAGAEDYRLTTPPDRATPAGLAERIAEYLASEGYAVRPAVPLHARLRAAITARTRFRRRPRARPSDGHPTSPRRGDRQLLRLIHASNRRTAQ